LIIKGFLPLKIWNKWNFQHLFSIGNHLIALLEEDCLRRIMENQESRITEEITEKIENESPKIFAVGQSRTIQIATRSIVDDESIYTVVERLNQAVENTHNYSIRVRR
jgi:hypothetical protein